MILGVEYIVECSPKYEHMILEAGSLEKTLEIISEVLEDINTEFLSAGFKFGEKNDK